MKAIRIPLRVMVLAPGWMFGWMMDGLLSTEMGRVGGRAGFDRVGVHSGGAQ